MRTPKYFLISHPFSESPKGTQTQKVLLAPEETHHLKHVLKIGPGDQCIVSDGRGHEFLGQVGRFLNDGRSEIILSEPPCREREIGVKLLAAQAIPQRGKMDAIAEKAAELGVFTLIPLLTERTIVKPKNEQQKKMRSRWESIARQATKQARIPQAPAVTEPAGFSTLWSGHFSFDRAFLFHPDPKATPLQALDFKPSRDLKGILLIIGPEGGFSEKEIQSAKKSGAEIVRMGPATLKTDTAFVAAVSFFQMMLERS